MKGKIIKKLILTYILIFPSYSYCQNLIGDPSFEDKMNPCPPPILKTWEGRGNLIHKCIHKFREKPSVQDEFPFPRTGDGYVYMLTLHLNDSNASPEELAFRRYIIFSFLNKKIKKGKRYYCKLYISNANVPEYKNGFGNVISNNVGFKFFYAEDSSDLNIHSSFFSQPPQFNISEIIETSYDWTKFEGTFVAGGNYNAIAIGNFFTNSRTKFKITGNRGVYSAHTEYLFDDIGVFEIPLLKTPNDPSICIGDSVLLKISGGSDFYWSLSSEGKDTFSTDSAFWVKPLKTTSYFLNSITQDTITIKVFPPPTVSFPGDTTLCHGERLVLSAMNPGANYFWNTGDTGSKIEVTTKGTYYATATVGSCSDKDTINIGYFPPPEKLEIEGETETCPEDFAPAVITANKGFKKYLWLPSGSEGRKLFARDTGEYELIVFDENFCQQQKKIFIRNNCPSTFFIPNSFSPNGDYINDIFKPEGLDVESYRIEIFNRFGEEIFSSDDLNFGWDGKLRNGENAPIGVYTYKLNYLLIEESRKNNFYKSGIIYLIK